MDTSFKGYSGEPEFWIVTESVYTIENYYYYHNEGMTIIIKSVTFCFPFWLTVGHQNTSTQIRK